MIAKFVQTQFALVAACFVTGCFENRIVTIDKKEINNPKDDQNNKAATSKNEELLLGKESGRFCPKNFLFNTLYRMCVTDKEALGPFSTTMVQRCLATKNEPALCNGNFWPIGLTKSLRGIENCMPGTTLDSALGVCTAEDDVFGPFPADLMDVCAASAKEYAICETMRWSRNIFTDAGIGAAPTTPTDKNEVVIETKDPESLGSKLTLWATYYNLPLVNHNPLGLPLRSLSSEKLGPVLERKDWCAAAMEGSVKVISGPGAGKTYNYAGRSSAYRVNCSAYYSHSPSGEVKFRVARGPHGDGVMNYKLVPYRTIAVDPSKIPYGSVVYIPSAKGVRIQPPSGASFSHDGYFFAGDTGGLIKGNHIDVFVGEHKSSPFSFVKSKEYGTFSAFIIRDTNAVRRLRLLHTF